MLDKHFAFVTKFEGIYNYYLNNSKNRIASSWNAKTFPIDQLIGKIDDISFWLGSKDKVAID